MPLMKCGHMANAHNAQGNPTCVICIGIKPGADEIADEQPDLTGRIVKCTQCCKTRPSTQALAFFEHRPDAEYDSHYDGCMGWD